MIKMNRNFNEGKIYKIEPINPINIDDVYIGSTTKKLIEERFNGHIYDYERYKNGKYHYITSFKLFDKYGIENCKITLIENCPCSNVYELLRREAYYINLIKCINISMKYKYKNITMNKPEKTKQKYKFNNQNKKSCVENSHKKFST
jgi:hypothetical protein